MSPPYPHTTSRAARSSSASIRRCGRSSGSTSTRADPRIRTSSSPDGRAPRGLGIQPRVENEEQAEALLRDLADWLAAHGVSRNKAP